jgi:3-oxoacyl-[acyl-carrier protein] reductase
MRAALVTGVSRRAGIGFAIAQRLAEAGGRIFTQGWTPHDAAQPWGADEGFAPSIEADFGEADAPARVVAAAREALGPSARRSGRSTCSSSTTREAASAASTS